MWSLAALVFLTCKWGQWYLIQRLTMRISEYVKHSEQWLAYSLLSSSNTVPMSLLRLLCLVPFLMNKGGPLVLKDWFKLFFSFLSYVFSLFIHFMDNQEKGGGTGSEVGPRFCFRPSSNLGSAASTLQIGWVHGQTFSVVRSFFCWTWDWLKIKLKDCLALRDVSNSVSCVWLFIPGNHGRWKLLMAWQMNLSELIHFNKHIYRRMLFFFFALNNNQKLTRICYRFYS